MLFAGKNGFLLWQSGARFDPDKTKWYNHQYLQGKTDSKLASSFQSVLADKEIPHRMTVMLKK